MGSGGGGGGQTTTVTKSDPWAGQQPYLSYGFGEAQNLYRGGTPQYYQGNTVAPLSATTNQAMGLQAQRALSGSPVTSSAQNLATNTLNGNFLAGSPYLDANFNAGAQAITNAYQGAMRGVNAGASGNGRYGSGMQMFAKQQQDNTLANNLGNLYSQTYFNNYNNERANQMATMGQAPSLAAVDYADLSKLSDVGATQDAYNQSLVDADVNRWNYNQNLPMNKLAQYMGMIQGNYGGSTATQTPLSGQSTLGNLLAGGLGAAGLYNAMKS